MNSYRNRSNSDQVEDPTYTNEQESDGYPKQKQSGVFDKHGFI